MATRATRDSKPRHLRTIEEESAREERGKELLVALKSLEHAFKANCKQIRARESSR